MDSDFELIDGEELYGFSDDNTKSTTTEICASTAVASTSTCVTSVSEIGISAGPNSPSIDKCDIGTDVTGLKKFGSLTDMTEEYNRLVDQLMKVTVAISQFQAGSDIVDCDSVKSSIADNLSGSETSSESSKASNNSMSDFIAPAHLFDSKFAMNWGRHVNHKACMVPVFIAHHNPSVVSSRITPLVEYVNLAETIWSWKKCIAKERRVFAENVKLIYRGAVMDDFKLVGDYISSGGCQVTLILCSPRHSLHAKID